jgi:hypothetical protein
MAGYILFVVALRLAPINQETEMKCNAMKQNQTYRNKTKSKQTKHNKTKQNDK